MWASSASSDPDGRTLGERRRARGAKTHTANPVRRRPAPPRRAADGRNVVQIAAPAACYAGGRIEEPPSMTTLGIAWVDAAATAAAGA